MRKPGNDAGQQARQQVPPDAPSLDDPRVVDLGARIKAAVDDRRELYLSFLATLLRFETVSGQEKRRPPRSEDPAFQAAWHHLRQQCERLGLTLRTYDDIAGSIEWTGTDPDAPVLGIGCHLDVVPADKAWAHPPFGGTIHDGAVWGRGAQDDKGPLAMVLSAIDAMQTLGLRPRRTIRILIGTYEETEDWPDMDRLLEEEGRPDQVLVPDGGFPLGIGEKGITTIEWSADWPRHTAGDVLRFVRMEGGDRANVVPGSATVELRTRAAFVAEAERIVQQNLLQLTRNSPRAFAQVDRGEPDEETSTVLLRISFRGHPAHAAMPQDGHNAAHDALAFLGLLPELPEEVAGFAAFVYNRTRLLDASGIDLDRVDPQMGGTTLNLGKVRIDRAGGHAFMNIRFPVGLTARDVEDACRRAAAACVLKVHTEPIGRPQLPFLVDDKAHADFLRPLEVAYESVTGVEAKHLTIAGTTYAKLFPLAVGFGPVDLVRGEPVLVHQPDERVSVERHLENIRIYAMAMALLADAR